MLIALGIGFLFMLYNSRKARKKIENWLSKHTK